MINRPLRLAVLVASVRSPRLADALLPWLEDELLAVDGFDVDVVDLADHDLDPRRLQPGGATSPIAGRLAGADAFLVLTPEYNHSFPAALKNAIDWHVEEWRHKPVAFVSYGAGSGGLRAVEQLRLIFPELRATTVRDAVTLRAPWEHLDDEGRFQAPPGTRDALVATLDELRWWAETLRSGRERSAVAA